MSDHPVLCPLCGRGGTVAYRDLEDNLFSAPGTWSMNRCLSSSCGIFWIDPCPGPEELSAAYAEYYTHGDTATPARRMVRALARQLAGIPLLPFGILSERRHSDLMFLQGQSRGRLLDVGCGKGEFLSRMKARGWDVVGVDFDPQAAHAAKVEYGIEVHVGDVERLAYSGVGAFDVITASHVIEHLLEPERFLSSCAALLKDGGKLILKTPNIESMGHRTYGRHWRGLEPPRHIHLFSCAAVSALAKKCGFASEVWTSAAGAEYILGASAYMRESGEFRPDHLSLWARVKGKIRAVWLAVVAQLHRRRNPMSGEEICAVLRPESAAARES